MKKGNAQRGFTLIELMFASAASGVVILASTAFLLKALAWQEEISAKIEMNRHARASYELWAYGGMSTATGKDGTKYVYGFRGSNQAPTKDDLRTSTDALSLKSNNITLTPDKFASMTITCAANGAPVPDCNVGKKGTSTVTVGGWLGDDPDIKAKAHSIGNGWATITFTVTDPFESLRATGPDRFTDTYRTVFTLNRTERDP